MDLKDDDDRIIKQDSPSNILWQLFRISVEQEKVPKSVTRSNKEKIAERQDSG